MSEWLRKLFGMKKKKEYPTEIPPGWKVCPKCWEVIRVNAWYCNACGEKLMDMKEEEGQTPKQ